jgi:hypothetical protein
LAKATWLGTRPFSGAPGKGSLRQGDMLVGYYHQLRTEQDPEGPGPAGGASHKVPLLGEYEDRTIELGEARLTLRVWHGWMMVLEQSCEIEHKHANDSRLLVAPIAFRKHWDGPFWASIRAANAPGFLFLPPMSAADRARYGAHGWPLATDAAVVLESTTCVSRHFVPGATFGLDSQMRAALQQRLVDFWSVRGWMRSKHRETILGRRITEISQTYEQFLGPGRLHKVALDGDEEITVGFVFTP